LKQKEDIHMYQSENTKLTKSLEEKTSSIENLNIQLLETKSRLTVVEQTLKEKEERLASNDKGNYFFIIINCYDFFGIQNTLQYFFC